MSTVPSLETLEARIAPAAVLVDAKTFTYTDIDGDAVTVKTTGGPFVFANGPNGDFGDSFVFVPNASGGQQLVYVDLTLPGFAGADLTFTVAKAGAGDGLAAVGYINALGVDLGAITVKGDLNEIDCGDGDTATPAIELLSVRSLGRYGDLTDSLVPGLVSDIKGAVGALKVAADIKDARIDVTATVNADAKIGSITIGGSLIGGTVVNSGSITAEGEIGPVKVGRDIVGGDGNNSGRIFSGAKVGAVTIGGSLVGGAGNESGSILGNGGIGAMKIGGNVVGGLGDTSGRVAAFGQSIRSVSIGGSLLGGAGSNSGAIYSNNGMGPVKILHDVVGGAGDFSGSISSDTSLGTAAIAGSLLGGGGESSAGIIAVNGVGAVTIGHDVKGGSGVDSAKIQAGGTLGAITIGGSLLGGSASGAGSIGSGGGIGAVKIGHDIVGGSDSFTALIATDGPLVSVTLGGSLIGGTGIDSGSINSEGNLGPVKIGHDVMGGSETGSGRIRSSAVLVAATIGGSVFGSTGNGSGSIVGSGGVGTVKIGHDLLGGSITGMDLGLDVSGAILSVKGIASVTIGGSIIAGIDASSAGNITRSATIRAAEDIGSVTVKGGLIGNVGTNGNSFVVISAVGQATPSAGADVAIRKVSIGGRAEFAQIFGGYNTALNPVNADAQIGSVKVGADWVTSSIVAGAANEGADPGPGDDNIDYGNPFDVKITGGTDVVNRFSKIGRIEIVGQAFGVPGSSRDFGLVAEEIAALKIGGATFTLQTERNNDGRTIGQLPHFALHEIGALIGSTVTFLNSAKLVNASTVTYDDIDGDHVTVKLTKPLLTAGNVNAVFKFDTGMVDDGVLARQQLQLLDLKQLASNGLGVTITVTPGGGDRLANVGAILSDDDLGTLTIPGDLGQIAAGDADGATRGLAALNVRTFGRLGLDTQPAASATFVPFVGGDIIGGLGALAVKQDFAGANLAITGGLGLVTIGGSLIGGGADGSGRISSPAGIGAVKIGLHLQGGTGIAAGSLSTDIGAITSATIGGSLIGGGGLGSGRISSDVSIGRVKIGHNLIGGTEMLAGSLSFSGVASLGVGGSLLGGAGISSGQILAGPGGIGAVKFGHNIVGGTGDGAGKIDSGGKIAGVTLGGSLLGGTGDQDTVIHGAQIFAVGDIGPVMIGRNLAGAAGDHTARIDSGGTLARLTIGGAMIGGTGNSSGYVQAEVVGAVKIGRSLLGGSGSGAGYIEGFDSIGGVAIGGSLVGGASTFDGAIFTAFALGPVKIGHDLHGGADGDAGSIKGLTSIASLTIGGSLVGGSSLRTGAIIGGDIGAVKIGRDLIGGSIGGATATLEGSGYIEAQGRIASIRLGGSIIAGIDDSSGGALTKNASIRASDDIGALSVKGSLIGNVGDGTAANLSKVIISASGQATLAANPTLDLAIKSISIGGRVERGQILAGYSTALGVDGPGSIGPVSVGGDWTASDLVAGAMFDDDPTAPNLFGDFDDVPITQPGTAIIARIAAINIKGAVVGTEAGMDHFGFVSHVIGSFKSLGIAAVLGNSPIRDVIELSLLTRDVTVREV